MSDKKEMAIIIVLLVVIVSAIYGIVHVPPPEYASRYELLELKKEVAELRDEVKRETDPTMVQQRTLKYILEKEIDRHEK